jgi:hypothetical protein
MKEQPEKKQSHIRLTAYNVRQKINNLKLCYSLSTFENQRMIDNGGRGGTGGIALFDGSQTSLARPSHVGGMKVQVW